MKIILHMGQGKTGTTALQGSLAKASGKLRERGILYPRSGYVFLAHHLLVVLSGRPAPFPLWRLAGVEGPKDPGEIARRAWTATCDEVRRDRPEVLVLSSEQLLHHTDAEAKARLAGILSDLSPDITPVVYVRHPVDYYRAGLQEWVKRHDSPHPPSDRGLKQALLDTEATFGRKPELVLFDRRSLAGGDIVRDFATRFLGPTVDPEEVPSHDANVGLSTEALVVMSRLRAAKGWTDAGQRQVEMLTGLFRQLDAQDPPEQPFTLLPEVAEAALRSATSYRWLAETGRLRIPGLDVDRIDGAAPPGWMMSARPVDLFRHDQDRLDRMRRAVERHLDQHGWPADPWREPKVNLRDFLLRFLLGKLGSR